MIYRLPKFTEDRNIPKVEEEDLEKDHEDFFLEGTFGKFSALDAAKKDIVLAQEEQFRGNIGKAIDCYVKGLLDIHYGGWDIWQGNSVEEATKCFDNIQTLCKTPVETVKQLEEIITNESYCNNWEIANRLYNLISSMCSKNEQQQITDEILKHLETIVKPSEKYIVKYSDIANENYIGNPDEALLDLILQLAWYPDNFVSQKVFELLPWIIKENPYYLVNILKHCFDEDINSAELCVTICLNSSDTQNPFLWELINNYDTLGKVINSKYFIIKSTFLQIYSNFLDVYPEATSFIDTIQHYFEIPAMLASEETVVDPSITEIIKKIDRESIFDRLEPHVNKVMDIKLDVLTAIEKKISPKTIFQLYNLDFALCKSFYRNSMHLGYLDTMLFENINEILCSYISPEKSERIANDIRRLNPFFPVQKFESYSGFKKASRLKKILYEDNLDPIEIQESISDDTHTMLYYQNYEYRNKDFSHIELIAYIVPKHFEIEDYFTDVLHRQEYHYSNEYFRTSQSISDNVIYPVEVIIPYIVQGRPISPCFPSNAFKHLISVDDTAFQNDLWLSGRLWNDHLKGFPLNEGCSTKIPTEFLSNIKLNKKIIYKLSDEVETIIIDTYKRSIIKIGGIE